jgi:hypothetical protein
MSLENETKCTEGVPFFPKLVAMKINFTIQQLSIYDLKGTSLQSCSEDLPVLLRSSFFALEIMKGEASQLSLNMFVFCFLCTFFFFLTLHAYGRN